MPDWMKYNGVKRTAVASGRRCDERARRMMGVDEHSLQWRGEACRACRFWSGTTCLDDWEAYRSCPLVVRQRAAGPQAFAGHGAPAGRATGGPVGRPAGGVRLFDF